MMNNGAVTVELSNGQKVTLDSIKKMQGDISKKADDDKTVHIGDYGIGDGYPSVYLTDRTLGNEFIRSSTDYTDGFFTYYYGITLSWDGREKSSSKMQILTGIGSRNDLFFRHANNEENAPLSFTRAYRVYSEKN
ncbi:hypothetical protein, partial [Proteus mirabilis]|uniref:hypothetical protein n=1 Tax=Proteus mirabilis TaxID=584 RepID=UPI002361B283